MLAVVYNNVDDTVQRLHAVHIPGSVRTMHYHSIHT